MSAALNLKQHRLALELTPISVGELFISTTLKKPAYLYQQGVFQELFPAGSVPPKEELQNLIKNKVREVFIYQEDFNLVKDNLDSALIQLTRSLSVGDPVQNGPRHLRLMGLNLKELYKNPHTDERLTLQYQSAQNLTKFIGENKKHLPHFYKQFQKNNLHFTIQQPMLSSILLSGFMQSIHLFHEKEIETLFLASYFKDLGIGLIPEDKYDQNDLSFDEQGLFSQHTNFSFDLLSGRVPIGKNYLDVIKNHHYLNDRLQKVMNKKKWTREGSDMILGLETTLVAVADMFVAMISPRPYREPMTIYQALEVIKEMIADDYPQEFKALVNFIRQFFK